MDSLIPLYGHERTLQETSQAIHFAVQAFDPKRVGALHVTCADEAELECSRAFDRGFVQFTLPSLKSGLRAPFTLANLGARYEWGAVRVAEDHFTDGVDEIEHPLLVVKINAHVGCEPLDGSLRSDGLPVRFGARNRYGRDTTCCGMLAALQAGSTAPAADDLRELFGSEGKDRLASLQKQDEALRPLLVALTAARLQARAAILDIQDHAANTPTSFLVLACVTLNRPGPDSEILCGRYFLDGHSHEVIYHGLGDDPAAYEVGFERGKLVVTDDALGTTRPGRDHRALARREFERFHRDALADAFDASGFEGFRDGVAEGRHRDEESARRLLRIALPMLSEVAPVPAAVLFFAEGAAGIHHAFKVHRLRDSWRSRAEARRILEDVEARLETLPTGAVSAVVESLADRVRY